MRLTQIFSDVILPGACVFDIGGFDGSTASLFAEIVGPSGRVYSFEPNPLQFSPSR